VGRYTVVSIAGKIARIAAAAGLPVIDDIAEEATAKRRSPREDTA
jgi:hypothetical protein